jgi:hypothetical protein
MAIASAAILMLIAYVDYVTGYELVFSAAYLIPVSLCAWYFGLRTILLISIASGVATWFMDKNHPYSHYMFQFWNSFTCFLISLLTGLLLRHLKHALEERKQMNNDLQKAMETVVRVYDLSHLS